MLKKKLLIKHSEEKLLHHKFDGFRSSILQNIKQNSIKGALKGQRYNNAIKKFALTWNYYSSKAYAYVQSIMPLSHPSLIRKWASNVNCEPGFHSESFHILEEQVKKQKIVTWFWT